MLWTPEQAEQYANFNALIQRTPYRQHTCSVYESPKQRFTDRGCGAIFSELGQETYPTGFFTSTGEKHVWEIVRCRNHNKWIAGFIFSCGYFITDETVQALQQQKLVRVEQDVHTRLLYLVDPIDQQAPIIQSHFWQGSCNRCGWCCRFPNPKTKRSCEYLVPEEPILRTQLTSGDRLALSKHG